MKQLITTICALLIISALNAQGYKEILHLKSGEKVKGVILEEAYGKYITIQNEEGEVLKFPMSEVEKKTKAIGVTSAQHDTSTDSQPQTNTCITKGYRCFIFEGIGMPLGEDGELKTEISTTHGYQFNPNIFAGAGISEQIWLDSDVFAFSLYGKFRVDMKEGRWSPFASLRIGYTFADESGGIYLSPTFGFRLANRLNIAITPEFSRSTYEDDWDYQYYHEEEETYNIASLMIRVGIDLGARK